MSDIDSQIASIKNRISAGQLAAARASVTKESAEAAYAEAMNKAYELFGVDSVEGVRAKLLELQTSLKEKMQEATKILDEINL